MEQFSGPRQHLTRRGPVPLPAFIPVTTLDGSHPLDELIRPYLARLAPAVMVSYLQASRAGRNREAWRLPRPLFLDSGGFALLTTSSRLVEQEGLGVLEVDREDGIPERIHPRAVLELQEELAEVAFTLDFPLPPVLDEAEAHRRQALTLANARWALANRRRPDLLLFASLQAPDPTTAGACARNLAALGFDGVALGGLVPRARDRERVRQLVAAVREGIGELPLHVFGLGHPELVELVFRAGATSVDSSSYVQLAAQGRLWSQPDQRLVDPAPTDRLHLALCNLAAACGAALPLPFSRLLWATHALQTADWTEESVGDPGLRKLEP